MIYNGTVNDYEKVRNSCKIYIVLFVIAFLITIGINSAYAYFYWHLKNINTNTSINTKIGTTIY